MADTAAPIPEAADPLEEVGAGDLAQALTMALERRLARLGYDIHDGPLQKLSLLSGELALLRRQLPGLARDDEARRLAEGRLGDVAALVEATSSELRSLLVTQRPVPQPLREALEELVGRFRRETSIQATLDVGSVQVRTESQRIACLRIVEEALANVRRHSGAHSVRISVLGNGGAIVVSVTDDGRGFDVTRATRSAARDGRLGLVALSERARLLGGRLEIWSRKGGPTVVTAMLPVWEPGAKTQETGAPRPSGVSA